MGVVLALIVIRGRSIVVIVACIVSIGVSIGVSVSVRVRARLSVLFAASRVVINIVSVGIVAPIPTVFDLGLLQLGIGGQPLEGRRFGVGQEVLAGVIFFSSCFATPLSGSGRPPSSDEVSLKQPAK
jgi:hypothetical protein